MFLDFVIDIKCCICGRIFESMSAYRQTCNKECYDKLKKRKVKNVKNK